MSFTSFSFLVFFALFASLWPWARKSNHSRWWLICAFSFFFYGFWDFRFLFLLMGTGLVDFWAALAIDRQPLKAQRKLLLATSLSANLGVLFFFKYTGFFATETHRWFSWPSAEGVAWTTSIVLPVGISFYTFQSMSYTIDVYRGQLRPTRSIPHFFAYLSLFPQLVAGPIVRAVDLLPHLLQPGDFSAVNRWRGLERIALGFFKKLVIADNAAPFVNYVFSSVDPSANGGFIYWLAALFFALQIYCDFSGYSDIAIGLAAWMGYKFPENFNSPYSSLGFREFWSRWHISLSTWFRDYVYFPLGGNRVSPFRQHLNLWLTLISSGIWHGANWTYLVWGATHAAILSIERMTRWPEKIGSAGATRWGGILFTFLLTLLTWVLFRANSLPQAFTMIRAMLMSPFADLVAGVGALDASQVLALGAFILLSTAEAACHKARCAPNDRGQPWRTIAVVLGLLCSIFLRGSGNDFIYFQF